MKTLKTRERIIIGEQYKHNTRIFENRNYDTVGILIEVLWCAKVIRWVAYLKRDFVPSIK